MIIIEVFDIRLDIIGENIGDVVVKYSDDIKMILELEDIDVVILIILDNVV